MELGARTAEQLFEVAQALRVPETTDLAVEDDRPELALLPQAGGMVRQPTGRVASASRPDGAFRCHIVPKHRSSSPRRGGPLLTTASDSLGVTLGITT